MPKRDVHYMEGQREMIARAALECILERGVAATSTREICIRSGVSKGALYSHFKSREEIIFAACQLDSVFLFEFVDDWSDYEAQLSRAVGMIQSNARARKLVRAGYEFLIEVDLADRALPDADDSWDSAYAFVRTSLEAMYDRGQISLPLGLDATVEAHVLLVCGGQYLLMADRRLDFARMKNNFSATLALMAGRHMAAKSDDSGLADAPEASANAIRHPAGKIGLSLVPNPSKEP